MQAEGSAYEENQKYLDSIQGRIDQFTNAVQAMWSNVLDDELIKNIVSLGTALIQTADDAGVLRTALFAIATISMIKAKTGPIGFFADILDLMSKGGTKIREFTAALHNPLSSLKSLLNPLTEVVAQQQALQASNLALQFNEQKLTQAQLARKLSTIGLSNSVKTLNVAEVSNALRTTDASRAQRMAAIETLGLNMNTKALTATEISNALAAAGVSEANITATLSALGLSTANKGLAASFGTLWTAMWPVLAIMGGAAIIAGIVWAFDKAIVTTEELAEELSDLKSELTDIQSEISSVNSELQTTQERIDELLGKDKLSFTEEEELKNLQKQNDELQRKLDLLELEEKQKSKEAADKFVETMESDHEYYEYQWEEEGEHWYDDAVVVGKEEAYFNRQLDLYKQYQQKKADIEQDIIDVGGEDTKEGKKLAKEKEKIDKHIKETEEYLKGKIGEWNENAEGLDYGIDPEADKWLDYIADMHDKWAIISGGTNAKSNAIKRILNKDEFSEASEEINNLVEQLENGADESSIEKQIEGIINKNDALKTKLEELGITTNDAASCFAQLGEAAKEAADDTSKITDSLSKISTLENAFNSLGDAIKEFKEDGTASADTLANLMETFGDTEGFEELYQVLATGEGNIEEAITNVANAYINQKGILSDLTQDELNIMAARLESLGVMNAQEVLMARQTAQEKLNTALQEYNIDLSNYATAEQAKIAIAVAAGLDFSKINDENLQDLITKYGIDVSKYATAAEQKIAIAKEMAKETARANKEAALSAIYEDDEYTEREIAEKKVQLEAEYDARIASIDAIDATIDSVQGIVDSYYGATMKFNLSGNQVGIGRDFGEKIDTDDDSDSEDKLDKLRKKYENKISQLEAQQTYLENEVARMEAEDEQVGKGVYEEQIRLENEKIKLLEQERAALLAEMKNVAKDSDEWYEFADAVWETEHAIQDSTLAIVEFEQKIVDLYTNVFDKIAEAHDNLNSLYSSKQDFINNDIEYAELVGQPVTADMYRERRTVQEEDYANARAKAENLYSLFQQGLAAGDIKEGTEEYADMALQIADAATEVQTLRNEIIKTNDELAQLYVTAFDKVGEAFDALGNLYSDRTAYAEGYKELQELRGEPISTGTYDYLISNEQDAMADNIAKLAAQEEKFKDALANGIKEGDEDWIKMQEDIRATEKAIQDNQIAIENYNEELKQLYYTAFEKVRDSFGNVTDIYDDQKDFVQSYIDYLEMMGVGVPEEMFNKLNDIELNKQITNRNALADMIKARDELLAQGFTYEDDELVQAEADIRAMERAIWDSEVAMAEVNKRIRELDTEKFEEFMKRVGAVADELERVYDLLSDEDVANEDGSWTAEGIASLGLMYQKMEIAKKQISEYQKEIEELNEAYKSGAMSEQEYNDKLSELKSSQWDAIESYESAKDAIVDLNEARIDEIDKGINKEIEAYEELISLKKKELDAERDLYEFRKDTQKQTKDITTLERRIAAMAGSTDAATIAERTKLEAQLAEAREGLDDTYYSHAMDSQSSALDDEQESYVTSKEDYLELLRESLEDTEQIVAETMAQVLVNADTVLGELNGVSTEYGITLSDQLTYPWINAAAQAEAFKNSAMASEYGFIIQNGIFTGTITDQILAMFGSGSLAANNFQFGIESNIEAIRIAVENAKTPTQSGLIMPYENALDYVQNTFSLNVKDELQSVADKAHALVVDETTDLNAPWKSGKEAANTFGDTAKQVLDDVAEKAVEFNPDLSSEANAGKTAWENFATQVETSLGKAIAAANDAATKIGGNMDTIKTKAQAAYNAINSTYGNKNGGLDGADGKETDGIETNPITPKGTPTNSAGITALQNVLNMLFSSNLTPDGVWGKQTATALRNAQKTIRQTFNNDTSIAISGEYNSNAKTALQRYIDYKIAALRQNGNGSSMIGQGIQRYRNIANMLPAPFYAKGTMGTKKDQWAYTDEPWLGDELVMHATPQGTLSFMRAGSTVVPADITENLIEWGKMKPNMDGVANAISGINLMSNVINKPEVNFAIENLLRCDNVSQDTLPEVKKFITEELEKFTRNLNYSLRRVGAK